MKRESFYREKLNIQPPAVINWRQTELGERMLYSYRATTYDRNTFPSCLHYHDYYELLIFEEGEICYICESQRYQPRTGEVLLIPPGTFHMSVIGSEKTLYKRHVFYLYSDALEAFGCGAVTEFLQKARGLTVLSVTEQEELRELLHRLNAASEREEPSYKALAVGLVIRIFFLLQQSEAAVEKEADPLPEHLLAIKQYIDENYCELSSVSEVAERFFYSREYVARLFRRHFNTTVGDYVKARRIAQAQQLLGQGYSVTEVCYRTGFGNLSTFIRCFRSVVGTTPSAYRKKNKKVP